MTCFIDQLFALQNLEMAGENPTSSPQAITLRNQVPAQILGHFDRLRARGKKGVSVVRTGVCSECHMRVPIGMMATLMHGVDIQLCSSCGRYLYLPAEEHPEKAKPATGLKAPRKTAKRKAVAHVH